MINSDRTRHGVSADSPDRQGQLAVDDEASRDGRKWTSIALALLLLLLLLMRVLLFGRAAPPPLFLLAQARAHRLIRP